MTSYDITVTKSSRPHKTAVGSQNRLKLVFLESEIVVFISVLSYCVLSDTLVGYLITLSQFGKAYLIYLHSVGSGVVICCTISFDI